VNAIVNLSGERSTYIEPFMGGGYVLSYAANNFKRVVANDINPSLVAFWKEVIHDGWIPPSVVTKEEWTTLKYSEEVSALKAWAGCAASYNAKWFCSYGATANGLYKHDYVLEAVNSLAKKTDRMKGHPSIEFTCGDYRGLTDYVNSNSVVYCDPPYEGVFGYPYGGEFDTFAFWNVMAEWSHKGALIFVHEFGAPNGWLPALELTRTSTMRHSGYALRDVETLWTNGTLG
jgi:DNA adenine methylase